MRWTVSISTSRETLLPDGVIDRCSHCRDRRLRRRGGGREVDDEDEEEGGDKDGALPTPPVASALAASATLTRLGEPAPPAHRPVHLPLASLFNHVPLGELRPDGAIDRCSLPRPPSMPPQRRPRGGRGGGRGGGQ
jgi:hypothetical protein